MNLLKMIRILPWSALGVRRGVAHQDDIAGAKLPLLPFAAVVLAAGFGLSSSRWRSLQSKLHTDLTRHSQVSVSLD
jgi:hypothetical protein